MSDTPLDPDLDRALADLSRARRRAVVRAAAFMIVGALIGVGTHAFAGCATGTCVLWATPERAAIYGAVFGLIVASL